MVKVLFKEIEDAGIEVNCQMGISFEEHNEIRETEYLDLLISNSGQCALYFGDGMPALNGVSAGGLLNRNDVRNVTLKQILQGNS
jgi:hypothetical protein